MSDEIERAYIRIRNLVLQHLPEHNEHIREGSRKDLRNLYAALQGKDFPVDERQITETILPPDADQPQEIIHVRHEGSTLCRAPQLRGALSNWPKGHTWVYLVDRSAATCAECRERAAEKAINSETI